jgi:anaerobic ribonucleoside-triphosphate reductase
MKWQRLKMNDFPKELQDKRNKCSVWSRVMGYHRPINTFNLGKIGEHKERKHFKE